MDYNDYNGYAAKLHYLMTHDDVRKEMIGNCLNSNTDFLPDNIYKEWEKVAGSKEKQRNMKQCEEVMDKSGTTAVPYNNQNDTQCLDQAPYYIITMVFHDQSQAITEAVQKLDQELSYFLSCDAVKIYYVTKSLIAKGLKLNKNNIKDIHSFVDEVSKARKTK